MKYALQCIAAGLAAAVIYVVSAGIALVVIAAMGYAAHFGWELAG